MQLLSMHVHPMDQLYLAGHVLLSSCWQLWRHINFAVEGSPSELCEQSSRLKWIRPQGGGMEDLRICAKKDLYNPGRHTLRKVNLISCAHSNFQGVINRNSSSGVNLNSYSKAIFWGDSVNSKKEFKELFFRSKNPPRYWGVKITPQKAGVILYLKFLLHFPQIRS